jgi:hypothetical protein
VWCGIMGWSGGGSGSGVRREEVMGTGVVEKVDSRQNIRTSSGLGSRLSSRFPDRFRQSDLEKT